MKLRQGDVVILAMYLVLLAIATVPLFLSEIPPLVDYPNHLARTYILAHLVDHQGLQQYYAARWAPLPNLAMDVVVLILSRFVVVQTAGKLFLGLIFVLLTSGTMAIHAALYRRLSAIPLAAFFFLYNSHFLWGFVNYLFGLGLALWLFAAWVHWSESLTWPGLLAFVAMVFVIFFCHLYALGVYALAVIAYELGRWATGPRGMSRVTIGHAAMLVAQFVPTALVFLLFSPTSGATSSFGYGSLFGRLAGVFTVLNNYNLPLDMGTFLLPSLLALVGLGRGYLRLARPMLGVLAVFAVSVFFMPEGIFSAANCSDRTVPALAFLFSASLSVTPQSQRWVRPVVLALALLFAVRVGVVAMQWHAANAVYAEYQEAFARMPAGSKMAVKFLPGSSRREAVPPQHIGCMAIISRDAFVPILFAYRSQQPVAFAGPVAHLADREPTEPLVFEPHQKEYDYLLVINHAGVAYPAPPGSTDVYTGRDFRLYRL